MSESEEEENFCFFGKPLEPYDEDSFPKKKPIALEDQVATDSHGRRRFHGAFTGGFSAGFFNTVGSLEGWIPSEFKSTRQEKAQNKFQKPEDFMDDEDVGEFGIAPQTVQATKEYATSKKRKRQVFSDGPIPGEPVLHSILTSGNETIGYLLLKNMGMKARKQEQQESSNENRVYGCEMPRNYEISRHDDFNNYEIPPLYKEFLDKPKINTFGLGYVGLDKSHINLFTSSKLVINERNKKKVSIAGQAFGVGAFEDDDEDIYVKEDMSKYDFELTSESASAKKMLKKDQQLIFDEFILAKLNLVQKDFFPPPTIPASFTGKYKIKKSRFEPLSNVLIDQTPERKNMNADVRKTIYGETSYDLSDNLNDLPKTSTSVNVNSTININELIDDSAKSDIDNNSKISKVFPGLVFDRFVSASQSEDPSNILEAVKPMETCHGTEEMKGAVKMKMFGPLTRISFDWQPHTILCRRFNVPEPKLELDNSRNKKRTKNLIFQYQEHAEVPWMIKPGLSTSDFVQNTSNQVQCNENSNTTFTSKTIDITEEISLVEDTSIEVKNETVPTIDESKEEQTGEQPTLPIDITEKIGIEDNQDLYKAVFLSDSDSESEDEKNEVPEPDRQEEMKAQLLSETLLLPKIKPIKEGILSNVDFSIFNQTTPRETVKSEDSNIVKDNSGLYGPKLPGSSNVDSSKNSNFSFEIEDEDDWIEKDASDNDSKDSDLESEKRGKHKKKKHKSHKRKEKKQRKKHKHKKKR